MKILKLKPAKKGFLPFSGTPHVNSQRHLKGIRKFFAKREMEAKATYLLSINYLHTSSRYLEPGVKDQIELARRTSTKKSW